MRLSFDGPVLLLGGGCTLGLAVAAALYAALAGAYGGDTWFLLAILVGLGAKDVNLRRALQVYVCVGFAGIVLVQLLHYTTPLVPFNVYARNWDYGYGHYNLHLTGRRASAVDCRCRNGRLSDCLCTYRTDTVFFRNRDNGRLIDTPFYRFVFRICRSHVCFKSFGTTHLQCQCFVI